MSEYHDVHCPHCGNVFKANELCLSLYDYMNVLLMHRSDFEDDMGERVLGNGCIQVVRPEYRFLWYYSPSDITKIASKNRGLFELKGRSIIEKFGVNALSVYDEIKSSDDELTLLDSTDDDNVRKLMDAMNKGIPSLVKINAGTTKAGLEALAKYALDDNLLLKCKIKLRPVYDDRNNMIIGGIEEADTHFSSNQRYCPYCGKKISSMAGVHEEKIVCFLGTPYSGKTAYLTAAVFMLCNMGMSKLNMSVEISGQAEKNDDYINFMRNNYYPYMAGFAPNKTNTDEFPQLTIEVKNRTNDKVFLYTFVDIPGESFLTPDEAKGVADINFDELENKRAIMKSADILLFCVSSDQIFDDIESDNSSDPNKVKNVIFSNLRDIGINMNQIIKTMYGNGRVPAASLILTKSDKLSDKFSELYRYCGNTEKTAILDYFSCICSPPSCMDSELEEALSSTETLPPYKLEKIRDKNMLLYSYEQFREYSKLSYECFMNYGCENALSFMEKICDIFDAKQLVTFSTAPLGITAEAFPNSLKPLLEGNSDEVDKKIRHILTNAGIDEKRIASMSVPTLIEFEAIAKAYSVKRKLKPFNIIEPMMWIFAYTGMIDICEVHNIAGVEKPVFVPIMGESTDEAVKKKLSFKDTDSDLILEEKTAANIAKDVLGIKPPVQVQSSQSHGALSRLRNIFRR